jgi:flavin reductase (DIM6/NTAB) family NADH-FMN oxidoreductase RutF
MLTYAQAFARVRPNSAPVIKGGLGYLVGDIINHEEVGDHIVYYGVECGRRPFDNFNAFD